jgi:hypothetical protein
VNAPIDMSAYSTLRLAHGNVNVASNITKSSGADASLNIAANNSITTTGGADITSTSNKLNVVLNSDADRERRWAHFARLGQRAHEQRRQRDAGRRRRSVDGVRCWRRREWRVANWRVPEQRADQRGRRNYLDSRQGSGGDH